MVQGQNSLVTTINLGTVEQTLQFSAPTAASTDTITVSLTDHNTTTLAVRNIAQLRPGRLHASLLVQLMLCSLLKVFLIAYETSAGEVKITFSNSPSITLSTFTAAITTGTTTSSGISLTASSALPQNRTTAAISSLVSTQLDDDFSANGILRQATMSVMES